ncbi:acylneuraminate cytidylyltransferase family protein [Candidatus Njordibacter sp. Uisw_039]|uniref:acylneuraminate cytidylyltransferase family protein n=1 Tax=Candidatus Njordibacter sp. Uisw_039 TaxID=3230972 RepID=UPI003D49E2FC
MKVLALIPARSGSKGIKDKNIVRLGGHPLLAYSIAAAKLCEGIDEVIVSTDSKKYAATAMAYGGAVPFIRPKKMALDNSVDVEFFRHAMEWFKKNNTSFPELVVHLRPTSPIRDITVLSQAIAFMTENPQFTALRSAHETHLTPYKMFKNVGHYMKPFLCFEDVLESYNLPRQTFEKCFIPNGYVDILRPSVFMSGAQLHGQQMKLWETPEIPDIDTTDDLKLAEKLIGTGAKTALLQYLDRPT